jgi:ABC-type sugar transport system ATPase subunit
MKSADTPVISTPVLSVEGVSKSFGPVTVLRDIGFSLAPGTVTGLVGENGAGKSTLIRVLAGAMAPSAGSVVLGGHPLPGTTGAVIQAGLSVIYQELTDVPDMSLLENVLLGNVSSRAGFVRRGENRRRAIEGLRRVGLDGLDLATPIRDLTISQRQLAEIARCLVRDTRVLVLDEPTSALPERDVETLLTVVEGLRDEGIAVLYVTHHLDELFRISDRLIVLRDGAMVGDAPTTEWDERSLVRAMLAKDLAQAYPWSDRAPGAEVLTVSGLQAEGVRGTSLSAREHEIVGLVGLAGAGRTELMKAISGVAPVSEGRVEVAGRMLATGSIDRARRAGVVYAPEDRKKEGLVLMASIQSNLSYGDYRPISRFGVLRARVAARRATAIVAKYGIRQRSVAQPVGELSGGNQQKVVVARIAELNPRVAFFDDPTRGVDVGAKSGIYEHIFDLAEQGAAVFVTSSDTDEVLSVADRIYVLAGGRIVGEFPRDRFDREAILHLASGGSTVNGAQA